MKKEPIIYFPNEMEVTENKKAFVSQLLQIGKPSRHCYKYIHHSLNYSSHTVKELQELLKLEGTKVKIISILKMRNGSEIAVLHKKDERYFLRSIDKLFADLKNSLQAKELNFI